MLGLLKSNSPYCNEFGFCIYSVIFSPILRFTKKVYVQIVEELRSSH